MSKKNRQRREVAPPTPFEQARDELFQQIMRCDVIGAAPEHQAEWFTETMAYFADRYPELKPADIKDLRVLGERFVQPPKRSTEGTEPAEPPAQAPIEHEATDAVVEADATEAEQGETELVEVEAGEPVGV